jgi:hypothetical protein
MFLRPLSADSLNLIINNNMEACRRRRVGCRNGGAISQSINRFFFIAEQIYIVFLLGRFPINKLAEGIPALNLQLKGAPRGPNFISKFLKG